MDGWEFRRRQLLSSMAGSPVVVVSGHPDLFVAMRRMEVRAALRKPVDPVVLCGTVNTYCSGH